MVEPEEDRKEEEEITGVEIPAEEVALALEEHHILLVVEVGEVEDTVEGGAELTPIINLLQEDTQEKIGKFITSRQKPYLPC